MFGCLEEEISSSLLSRVSTPALGTIQFPVLQRAHLVFPREVAKGNLAGRPPPFGSGFKNVCAELHFPIRFQVVLLK